MSASRPWKTQERRHAGRMDEGERIWRQDFSEVAPDGENPREIWDSKRLKRLRAFVTWFYDHKYKYAAYADGRHFHMVINYSDSRRPDLVVCEADHYADLERRANA